MRADLRQVFRGLREKLRAATLAAGPHFLSLFFRPSGRAISPSRNVRLKTSREKTRLSASPSPKGDNLSVSKSILKHQYVCCVSCVLCGRSSQRRESREKQRRGLLTDLRPPKELGAVSPGSPLVFADLNARIDRPRLPSNGQRSLADLRRSSAFPQPSS